MDDRPLSLSLFLLRLSCALVMLMWALDKFVNPAHGAKVLEVFYGVGGAPTLAINALGAAQLIITLAFAIGAARTWTYGAMLAMHAISTAASWPAYLKPFDNLLFFAAFPMLAALIALFLLRERDSFLSLSGRTELNEA